jgi:hypothetical protein
VLQSGGISHDGILVPDERKLAYAKAPALDRVPTIGQENPFDTLNLDGDSVAHCLLLDDHVVPVRRRARSSAPPCWVIRRLL